ncbi:MAG: hypothetical protein AB8G22_04630, partial [Saprospiraceae bacterium]
MKRYLFTILIIISTTLFSYGGAGIFEYYIGINDNGSTNTYGTNVSGFGGNIATVNMASYSLSIAFTGCKVFEDGGDDANAARMYYRVYKNGSTSTFSSRNLPQLGSQSGNNTEWNSGSSINLLSGVTTIGTYVVEIYYEVDISANGGGGFQVFSPNQGSSYSATFEVTSAYPVTFTHFSTENTG